MSDLGTNIKYMFDRDVSGQVSAGIADPAADPPAVPLERLEAQICELAGHLAAATCRFLVLLADFDARRGWASWEMNSCAQWLSWKCQMSSGTAREHVRVARALYWINGGRTDLENLISLCPWHHKLVHDRGYLIAAAPVGGFAFYGPDGTPLPASPGLPGPGGEIGDCHDAEITPDTIIPPWYGERLDLDHAIYVCFANARTEEEKQAARDQASEPEPFRPRLDMTGPTEWIGRTAWH
jgi:hypothetical protein